MSVQAPGAKKLVRMPPEPVRPLTVVEYHQMIESGILVQDDPFGLLEGLLVPQMTRNPAHALALALADDAIGSRLPAGWVRRALCGFTTKDSEPEPDIAIVRGPHRRYRLSHPGPNDTALIVEIADATLQRDRTTKYAVYARAKLPVYWIVSLIDRRVEVYSDPALVKGKPVYRTRCDYGPTDSVPLVLDGMEIAKIPVEALLP